MWLCRYLASMVYTTRRTSPNYYLLVAGLIVSDAILFYEYVTDCICYQFCSVGDYSLEIETPENNMFIGESSQFTILVEEFIGPVVPLFSWAAVFLVWTCGLHWLLPSEQTLCAHPSALLPALRAGLRSPHVSATPTDSRQEPRAADSRRRVCHCYYLYGCPGVFKMLLRRSIL